MYRIIVILLRAFVVHALANDLDGPVGNASNNLHGSLSKMHEKFVNKLISRGLQASQHCCADLDGVTFGKHGLVPSVRSIAHQGQAAKSVPRLQLQLRASAAANEHSSIREVEIGRATSQRGTLASWSQSPKGLGPQAQAAVRFMSGARQLGRRAIVAGLMGGVPGMSVRPCWAASADPMQALTEEEGTVSYLSRHLENIRVQIGNIKTLVRTGEFRRAQDLLQIIEFGNLRKDVAEAETLTLLKPGSKLFDVAEVIEPLGFAKFALSRAQTRMDSLQNQLGLPASMASPDDVLFDLDRLQNGIGNVEEALKSISDK